MKLGIKGKVEKKGIFDKVSGVLDQVMDVVDSVVRLPIDYYMELYQGGKRVKVVVLPSQPQGFSIERETPSKVEYTFDDQAVFRQIGTPRKATITIKGKIGLGARLGSKANGIIGFLTPDQLVQEFGDFLHEYGEQARSEKNKLFIDFSELSTFLKDKRTTLVFRAVQEQVNAKVEVKRWRADRTRLSYDWSLDLEAYDQAVPPEKSWYDQVIDVVKDVEKTTNSIRAFGAVANNIATNASNVVSSVSNAIKNVALLPVTVESDFKNAWKTLGGVIDTIKDAIKQIKSAYGDDEATGDRTTAQASWEIKGLSFGDAIRVQWKNSNIPNQLDGAPIDLDLLILTQNLEDLAYSLELLQGYIVPSLKSDDLAKGFLRTDRGFKQLSAFNQGFDTTPSTEQEPYPTFEYMLRIGENLLTVASDLLNSPSDWIKLAKLNSCIDAHTKANGSVLQAGDIILVPTEETTPSFAPQQFTSDLKLVDGDLVLGSDDLALVSGRDAIKQSLIYRVTTEKGQLTLFPDFGIQKIVGSKNLDRVSSYLAVDIKEQILSDTRIIDIPSLSMIVDGDGVAVDLTCRTTLNDDNISLIAPI